MQLDTPFRVFQRAVAALPDNQGSLVVEIMNEINDPEFQKLRHGERHTRNQGCKGPLCKKALRDWMRARVRERNNEAGRDTRPHSRSLKYIILDPYLETIKLAHDAEFDARRKLPDASAELQTALPKAS